MAISSPSETNASTSTFEMTTPAKSIKQKRGGCRAISYLLIILLLCVLCLGALVATTWATGHLQSAVCGNILKGSFMSNRLQCEEFRQNVDQGRVDNPNSEFPVKVAEGQPNNDQFDVANIFSQVSPAIVGIGVKGVESNTNADTQVIGSGFIISEKGLVATNQHVVSNQNAEYFVRIEGQENTIPVKKIFRDNANDIAILEIEGNNLQSLTLGNSDSLKPGQNVVAIGNPLGELYSTVTAGIISGLNREVTVGDGFLRTRVSRFEDTIQTDAAINPGNSGGPLLNSAGQVIGINFATIQGYENLSFAIPVNYLKKRVDELRDFGRFRISYLGIDFRPKLTAVGEDVFLGAQVLRVDPNGPTASVLKVNDVILEYDGKDLETESLFGLIQKTEVGKQVSLVIIRGTQRQTVQVTIQERK